MCCGEDQKWLLDLGFYSRWAALAASFLVNVFNLYRWGRFQIYNIFRESSRRFSCTYLPIKIILFLFKEVESEFVTGIASLSFSGYDCSDVSPMWQLRVWSLLRHAEGQARFFSRCNRHNRKRWRAWIMVHFPSRWGVEHKRHPDLQFIILHLLADHVEVPPLPRCSFDNIHLLGDLKYNSLLALCLSCIRSDAWTTEPEKSLLGG